MLVRKKPRKQLSKNTQPVLIDPEDGLFQTFEKMKTSMTPKEFVKRMLEILPPSKSVTNTTPQNSSSPFRHPTDAENEEDERIANARGRRRC